MGVIYAAPGDRVCVKGYRGRRVGWLGRSGGLESTVLDVEVLELPRAVKSGATPAEMVDFARGMAEGTAMELVRLVVWETSDRVPEAFGAFFVESGSGTAVVDPADEGAGRLQ